MSQRFEDHVKRYHRLVMSLIHRYYGGGLSAHAEDLAQEIWVKLWDRFKRNESNIVNFKSYLYRTVQTTLWDAIRELESTRPVEEEPSLQAGEEFEARWAARHDVERLMRVLNSEERKMIKAHLAGFNYGEIAALLNCSQGRVRNLLTRIKKKMAGAGRR